MAIKIDGEKYIFLDKNTEYCKGIIFFFLIRKIFNSIPVVWIRGLDENDSHLPREG